MGKETRLAWAKKYAEASEKDKALDPLKNMRVYYEEFEEELKPKPKPKVKKAGVKNGR